jgi:hypothetical protein
MIVGRDTSVLDGAGVSRAAIESAAENFSDGLVAPVFWYALLGLPGLLVFKVVNTADSMIGHRSPRYEAFGWAAARLDDLMNLIPARLSALLIAAAAALAGGAAGHAAAAAWHDARFHRSPNAGWPEAAAAGALGLALGGPRRYGNLIVEGAWLNGQGRSEAGPDDIFAAIRLIDTAWALLLTAVMLIALWTAAIARILSNRDGQTGARRGRRGPNRLPPRRQPSNGRPIGPGSPAETVGGKQDVHVGSADQPSPGAPIGPAADVQQRAPAVRAPRRAQMDLVPRDRFSAGQMAPAIATVRLSAQECLDIEKTETQFNSGRPFDPMWVGNAAAEHLEPAAKADHGSAAPPVRDDVDVPASRRSAWRSAMVDLEPAAGPGRSRRAEPGRAPDEQFHFRARRAAGRGRRNWRSGAAAARLCGPAAVRPGRPARAQHISRPASRAASGKCGTTPSAASLVRRAISARPSVETGRRRRGSG